MSSISRPLCQHFCRSGMTRTESARWANTIQKWVRCSGIEWTAGRIKELQNFLHQRLQHPNQILHPPLGFAVRKDRAGNTIFKDGFLQRTFGVVGDLTTEISRNRRQLCEMFCKAGSLLMADSKKEAAIRDKLTSITAPHSGQCLTIPPENVSAFVNELVSICTNHVVKRTGTERDPVFGDPKELSPQEIRALDTLQARLFAVRLGATPLAGILPSGTKSWTYYTDKEGHLLAGSLPHSDVRSLSPILLISHKDTPLADPAVAFDKASLYQLYQQWTGDPFGMVVLYDQHIGRYKLPVAKLNLPVGKLAVLNKDGWAKRRIIAMPCLDLQTQLDPLKRSLNFMLMQFKASGVHDQDRARQDIAGWLAGDHMCFAYDQSSFTDRFPYALQKQLLNELRARHLGVTNLDIKMLDFAVHGDWIVPSLKEENIVNYAVGQPMGLNPSFALASLSHLMIAYSAYANTHDSSANWQDHVRIVGDDIVIKGRKTALEYDRYMTALGVTINYSKSMVSKNVSNFCGRILTKQGIDPSIRVKPRDSGASHIVEQLKVYGMEKWSYFRKAVNRFGDLLTTPEPIGLGIQPPGMSYSKFINQVDQNVRAEMEIQNDILSFIGPKPSIGSQRSAIIRMGELRHQWEDLGFIGQSNDQYSPSITAAEMRKYFGISIEAEHILDRIRFGLQRPADLQKDESVSSYIKLVDTTARYALTDVKANVVNTSLRSSREQYQDYSLYVNKFGYIDETKPSVKPLSLLRDQGAMTKETSQIVRMRDTQTLTRLACPWLQDMGVPPVLQIKVASQLLKDQTGAFYVSNARKVCANRQWQERFRKECFSQTRVFDQLGQIRKAEEARRHQRQQAKAQGSVVRERTKDLSRTRNPGPDR